MLRSINNVVENTSEDQENIDPQPNHTLPSSQQASHITQRDNTQIEILRVLQELRRPYLLMLIMLLDYYLLLRMSSPSHFL